jgi:hypothetical protein
MPDAAALQSEGLEFEALRNYPICVALAPTHRFARLKSITLDFSLLYAYLLLNHSLINLPSSSFPVPA